MNKTTGRTCFIISPIGDEGTEKREKADKVFNHIILPAAKDIGLEAIRSDHVTIPGMINAQIIRHILNDEMVVADLTDHNPNVFYELALRHAFRKPVVQLIQKGQPIPFDVQGSRTIQYELDLDGAARAREQVKAQMSSALKDNYKAESPVTIAARLDELTNSDESKSEPILQTILNQLDVLNKSVSEIEQTFVKNSKEFSKSIPTIFKEDLSKILKRYSMEISLLQAVRNAGVIGLYRRRESAIQAFSSHIDEESKEIMIVGSSLKGLLQKEEYSDIADKIKFKKNAANVRIRFLLTHPIVADFRANQENRRPTEIGVEIIQSLKILQNWGIPPNWVRLYLGTPTCFAIKTTRHMLINPYPYISVSFESPCIILEHHLDGGATRQSYFFEEFAGRHFGAWDTGLSVHIKDYNTTINECQEKLQEYADNVDQLLQRGKKISNS
ncbi:MAG: hypothetical protein AAGG68_24025 [Bacteroidota bacterium]